MKIKWRTCPQNRNYKISNTGLCKSTQARFEGKYLKPSPRPHFVDVYVLCSNYSKQAYPIRHLVYTAFVGEVPKGYIVYNKDGNIHNNNLDNLDIMRRCDKYFFYCKRTKKIPKINDKSKYTFVINGKTYETSNAVLKDYDLGTRQNLCFHADRFIEGKAPRGTKYNPKGFIIRGVLVYATKKRLDNPTKIRMDYIKNNYNFTKKD